MTQPLDDTPGPGPKTIAFLLLPEFSMLSVASALEPLRGANRLLGRQHYRWALYADGDGRALASNGIEVATDGDLGDLARMLDTTDFVFVCAGLDHDPPGRSRLHSVLALAARKGKVLGSLSAGSFILARAGLLKGYRCTIHWEFQPAFEEAFPEIECTSGLYCIDRTRWTGSGGVTGMDMMLQLLERDHGPKLSRSVGNQFQVDRIRNAAIHQRPGTLDRIETLPAPIQKAVTLMMGHLDRPLSAQEIADLAGLHLRRMERMFNSHLGCAPARFYRRLRLEKARELLLHTNLSTLEVGFLTGFSSSSHFALAFGREFGSRPSEIRSTTEAAEMRAEG